MTSISISITTTTAMARVDRVWCHQGYYKVQAWLGVDTPCDLVTKRSKWRCRHHPGVDWLSFSKYLRRAEKRMKEESGTNNMTTMARVRVEFAERESWICEDWRAVVYVITTCEKRSVLTDKYIYIDVYTILYIYIQIYVIIHHRHFSRYLVFVFSNSNTVKLLV